MSNPADDYSYKPYFPPAMTHTRRAEIIRAATVHAEANRSDPFSYGRSVLHMKRGLYDPSDILSDAQQRVGCR